VVTEYGIADLRGKTDAQVIESLLWRFALCNCLNRRNGPARVTKFSVTTVSAITGLVSGCVVWRKPRCSVGPAGLW
jgi:hypothetical protein